MALPVLNVYLDDDGDDIVVIEQLEDGTPRTRRVRAPYVSYHLAEDIDAKLMRLLKQADHVRSIGNEGENGKWLRIAWRNDVCRRQARYKFKDMGIETYEGDVDPPMYWLVSTRAKIAKPRTCSLDLETDSRVPLSRKHDMRVLSWAVTDFATGVTQRMALDVDTDEAEETLLEGLVAELRRFDQVLVWEGDWEGGEFDTVVTEARFRRRGLGVDVRDWMWLNQLAVWRKMNMHSAESGAEKESFKLEDIAFEQLGEGKEPVPDWVVERFGDRAKKGLGAITWELWEAGGKFRELLLQYNARDAELLYKLEQKKQYVMLFQALAEVCGVPPVTRSLQPTRQMDGFLLRIGRDRDHRFPTKGFQEEREEDKGKFKGAVVFHPRSIPGEVKEGGEVIENWTAEQARSWREKHGFKNGILHDVHVCDFASLYPSVMRTWNLSADVRVGWKTANEVKRDGLAPDTCWSPRTGLVTRTDVEGIIPLALGELIRLRKQYSDLSASLPPGSPEWQDAMSKSIAYKVAANSFYGGGGSKFSRFNDRDVSEATTQNSVHLLKVTASEAEKRSMVVVYGDTDSVFTYGPSEDGYRTFVGWLNKKRFPAEVASHGCKTNYISLAFEKTFSRIVFLSAKAYVGRYSQYKGKRAKRECHGVEFKHEESCPTCGGHGRLAGEPEIKGVAYKRGDRGKLARELQGKVIDLLVGGVKIRNRAGKKIPIFKTGAFAVEPELETPTEDLDVYRRLIVAARDYVLAGELSIDEVKLSAALKGPLKSYAKEATDAHVRVARMMEERGELVGEGQRIEYVVVDGEKSPQMVIPAGDYTGELDRFYLWGRVYGPSRSLLEAAFPDEDWATYADVRPPKPKGRAAKVPEEQLGLSLSPKASTKIDGIDQLAVPAFSTKPLVVRVPEAAGTEGLKRLAEAFKANPGAQLVEIVVVTKYGEAVLGTKIRVSTGPRLREAVDKALAVPA